MPKFRYSLDSGTSWVVVDETLPFSVPSDAEDVVWVEPIGGTEIADAVEPAPLDFIGYGQSNWLRHVNTTTDQPAASADTLMWDFNTNQWVTPTGNGLRNFLNAMQAATGRVCRMVYGGQSAVGIAQLSKGTENYTNLLNRVSASGADPSFIIFHQGEGDGNIGTTTTGGYQTALNTFHADLCGDLGKTRAQLPFICSSLATVTDPSFTQPDSIWAAVQTALRTINEVNANMHYSHSNMDALLPDTVHWDGPSYGRSGARYARTVQVLMGLQTTRPRLFMTAAERLTTTTTRVDITHGMGTDFTPSTGITGFEISGNNGSSWVSASAARLDADSITLTHSDLGTTARLIRYQYGKTPNVTAPVRDNSSLTNLLNFENGSLAAPGAVSLPTPTYQGHITVTKANGTDTFLNYTLPLLGITAQSLVIFQRGAASGGVGRAGITVTAQPSGTVVTATLLLEHSAQFPGLSPHGAVYSAVIPAGTTSIVVNETFTGTDIQTNVASAVTIPVAALSSTTPVAASKLRQENTTSNSLGIATSAGGVILAWAINRITGNTFTFSGDATFIERLDEPIGGGRHGFADATSVSASASSNVVASWATATNSTIFVVSLR